MHDQEAIFRIDKFAVPIKAEQEFLLRVFDTHRIIAGLDGHRQNLVLKQVSGPGRFNYVTAVEWACPEAFERAKALVSRRHAEIGLRPQELVERLGITADIANYRIIGFA